MSKPVSNPYAKRKPSPSTAAASRLATAGGAVTTSTSLRTTTTNNTTTTTATSATATTGMRASSFSQAFESIEDTAHYQGQIQKHKNTNTNNSTSISADVEARAQQRAFDAAAQQNFTDTSHASMSDRDQHVLLQPHVLYVSTKQRGNAILDYIRNVPWAYSKMVPDYIMSTTRCALFLSLKYHSLYPNYIHRRIAELRTDFILRVMLVLVDVQDNATILLFLNKLAITNSMTLILAWTEEEAARYLETFKAFDGKDASIIQKKEQTHFGDQVADFLGSSKGVNKTDSVQLLAQFSNLRSLMEASMDELGLVTGMGEVKVRRLHDAFHKPFSSNAAAKRRKTMQEQEEQIQVDDNDDDDDDDEGSKEAEFVDETTNDNDHRHGQEEFHEGSKEAEFVDDTTIDNDHRHGQEDVVHEAFLI
jgi:DNA excision repair protein ERCC-1